MANITIHAGDFGTGKATLKNNSITLPAKKGQGLLNRDHVDLSALVELETATEESVKRLGGTIGWGAAGAAILGPVGLLAGVLAGGRKNQITFVAKFSGDQKMLATTDSKTYKALMSNLF